MKKYQIPVVLTILLIFVLSACGPHQFAGTVLEPPFEVPDFTMEQNDGSTFQLSDYQGQYILIFFGYTNCPDVCPTTMVEMRQVVEILGKDAAGVQVVFVSVDPERDTREKLNAYVTNFNENFIGVRTDDLDYLLEITQGFGIFYEIEEGESASGYTVAHTASAFLLDKNNDMLEIFGYGTPAEDIARDVRYWLKNE